MLNRIVLIINSVLLAAANVLFSYIFVRNINIRQILNTGIGALNNELNEKRVKMQVRKYTRSISMKMSLTEKIELYLIDKSNIRHYIPFMNFYTLILLCLVIYVLVFGQVYKILHFIPSTSVVCCLFSLIPVFILDLMGRYNSEKIRRKLAEFISVLNRWCSVKEDIFYAFEKSIDSGIGEPLKTFITEMVIQVNRGIDPVEALDILQMKVDNPQFGDFIINIKQNIKHRGDIRKLLDNLEDQFYKIEEEYNRRRISTYKDRFLIYIVMFAVLLISYYFINANSKVKEFYLYTLEGKSLLTLFCILYAIGFYLSFRIMKFKH